MHTGGSRSETSSWRFGRVRRSSAPGAPSGSPWRDLAMMAMLTKQRGESHSLSSYFCLQVLSLGASGIKGGGQARAVPGRPCDGSLDLPSCRSTGTPLDAEPNRQQRGEVVRCGCAKRSSRTHISRFSTGQPDNLCTVSCVTLGLLALGSWNLSILRRILFVCAVKSSEEQGRRVEL